MSHHRYQTDGLVLGHYSAGEANGLIDVFTAELGRVRAVARSVREERSKLRFSLQDFSHTQVSLVRGKEVWRVVGAESHGNFFTELAHSEEKQEFLVNLTRLIRNLLAGEEENRALFTIVTDALTFVRDTELDREALANFECLTMLRVLFNLGYLAKNEHNARFLDTTEVNTNLVSLLSPMRLQMVKEINASLKESQL